MSYIQENTVGYLLLIPPLPENTNFSTNYFKMSNIYTDDGNIKWIKPNSDGELTSHGMLSGLSVKVNFGFYLCASSLNKNLGRQCLALIVTKWSKTINLI